MLHGPERFPPDHGAVPAKAAIAGALVLALAGLVLWLTADRGPEIGAVPATGDRADRPSDSATPRSTSETTPLIRPRAFTDDSTRPAEVESGSASIAGRVEVDGGQSKYPVRLTLSPAGRTIPVDPTATTGPDGAFEFARLRAGSEWKLSPELGYVLLDVVRDGRPEIMIAAPASGLLVKLKRVPVIRGRIVAGSPPAPVRGAVCKIVLGWANGSAQANLQAAADGRFRYALGSYDPYDQKLIKLVVTAQAPRNVSEKTVVVDPVPTADYDLGDIELSGLQVIKYLAVDSSGAPVAGAFARLGKQDGDVDPASRSGPDGRGAVTVAAEDRSFFLGALKHSVVEVPIPAPPPGEIPVTLAANAGLEIKVLTDPSTSPTLLRVRVSSKVPDMLARPAPGNDPIYVASGATQEWNSSWGSAGTAHFDLKQDGIVLFAGLKPGVPVEVAAIDKFGAVLAAVPDVTLRPAEWKTIELRVTRAARVLRGRVVDADGRAVPEAWLTADPDRKDQALRPPGTPETTG